MASGKLGSAALVASTDTIVYTVPSATVSTFNINVVNRGGNNAYVNIALSNSSSPNNEDYIEYGFFLSANGTVFERTGIVAGPGENVIINSSNSSCTVRIYGFEEQL